MKTIQFCALQSWPLSTATLSWGHLHLYQSMLRKLKPIQIMAYTQDHHGRNSSALKIRPCMPRPNINGQTAFSSYAHCTWPHGLVWVRVPVLALHPEKNFLTGFSLSLYNKQKYWARVISNFFPVPKIVENMLYILALTHVIKIWFIYSCRKYCNAFFLLDSI